MSNQVNWEKAKTNRKLHTNSVMGIYNIKLSQPKIWQHLLRGEEWFNVGDYRTWIR